MSTCIRLFDGTDLDLANPNYGAVSARNIVHGLSGVYRFGCQSPRRLTVAEHMCMGARLLRIPEVAQTLAHRHSLKRLAGWALRDSDAACDALSRAFLIHDMPEFCLHDLTTALKRMPELAGYKRIERMHMERLALALRVPYVCLDGRTAAEYEAGYRAAWENTRQRRHLYVGTEISGIAIPNTEEMEAHLMTAEVWAAVKVIDSALGAIEFAQAWEIGGPTPAYMFDLAVSAVDYSFLEPDHAYLALLNMLPREWR